MAFDQKTRNLLQRTVTACRRALDREFTAQLQELYGIQPDGTITSCAELDHLGDEELEVARLLRERINHLEGGSATEALTRTAAKSVHIARVIREQAFTVLNRLAALRLCEERDLVLECVRQGVNSEGFQLFKSSAGIALGETHSTYQVYLHCLFDELALDLGVLFDRFSPLALLFPRHDALMEVLSELNGTGKAAEREEMPPEQSAQIWQADETIGWIYQYYNDEAERKEMREESPAPRNSREMAVRNQFFTPRYVVEFLADNTLGRIWYEMTGGGTKFKEHCHYLVRRPNEVFLGDPKQAYAQVLGTPEDGENFFNEAVQAAFKGDLSKLTDDSGPDSRLISVAIPPDQFLKITGEPYQPMEDNRLGKLIHAVVHGEPNPDSENLLMLWAALSCFTLNEGGSAYSIEPWRKLWAKFVSVSRRPIPQDNLSQEDLLKEPVFIPYRPIKDPRTILMLDPACGSMHFGLYAFDLFEIIYDEAWELEEKIGVHALSRPPEMKSLHLTYTEKDAFLKDVPRLIIEHNLHGIDIDPRCTQIAGLSLWLRAQKAWQRLGLRPEDRPTIKRSNIVCAEPMPGEKEHLKEFCQSLKQPVIGQMVEVIFDKMRLAGEAGSLLKIEDEIRDVVHNTKLRWTETYRFEQAKEELFNKAEIAAASKTRKFDANELNIDFSGITDETFWDKAEERIYSALSDYSEQAENGGGFQRRLFAEDAARGFAFIDVCRKRYDVVVMNPPFGEASERLLTYLNPKFPSWNRNVLCAFIQQQFLGLAEGGFLASVMDRGLLNKSTYEEFRKNILLKDERLAVVFDLGWEVLDANVEVACCIARPNRIGKTVTDCFDVRDVPPDAKHVSLLTSVRGIEATRKRVYTHPAASFVAFPNSAVVYDLPDGLLSTFFRFKNLKSLGLISYTGHQLESDRHFMLFWEIPLGAGLSADKPFCNLYNGGEYCRFSALPQEVVRFGYFANLTPDDVTTYTFVLRNREKHFLQGVCFGVRGEFLDAHALPSGVLFTVEGQALPTPQPETALFLIGLLNSAPASRLLNTYCGQHKYSGYVNLLPCPPMNAPKSRELACSTAEAAAIKRQAFAHVETSLTLVVS